MTVHDEVLATLNALCEGAGVREDDDGDFRVVLGECTRWVRTIESPAAVYVFGSVATDVPRSAEVDEFLNDRNKSYVVFRALWEDEEIILRADLMAQPFVPGQLQVALEDFEQVAAELAPDACEWSRS
ncbi:MAG: YbjN domain-containing protein [Gemmatimonadetes bacterium]|nr:YbjN domain-containing protein [Gemmatimonadota bacterium]